MKRLLTFIICMAAATAVMAQQAETTVPAAKSICTLSVEQPLFKTYQGAKVPYRIPAIATAHNGNLIAVSDYRYCGGDIGFGRVDLHCRHFSQQRTEDFPRRIGDKTPQILRMEILIARRSAAKRIDMGFCQMG